MNQILSNAGDFLRSNPSLLIFAALAVGYALGKARFGSFSLGSTTGVLLVAIVLGAVILRNTQYDLGLIKTISFGFFIFTIGYMVGPDFVSGLKRGGLKYVGIAVFFCIVVLLSAIFLARAFNLSQGYAGGFLGGAMTQSTVIGTADGTIAHLSGAVVTSVMNLKSDVAVAYAVTYVFGTAGLIILLKLLPKIWRIDLPKEARKAEKDLGSSQEEDTVEAFHWSNLVIPRAFMVEKPGIAGRTTGEVEAMFTDYVSIESVSRNGSVLDLGKGDIRLQNGDVVILTGHRSQIYKAAEIIGQEEDDRHIREMIGEILGICLTNRELDGKTLEEVFRNSGHGCFVQAVYRQTHQLPLTPGTVLYRGDVIRVIGSRPDVEKLVELIGYPERKAWMTDIVTVGVGLIIGTLIGLMAVNIGGIPVTLGVGGGILVSGILFGWLRSVKPTWGQIPIPTQWIFTSLGLNLFIACVGISAGPRAVEAIAQAGVRILLAGVCLTSIPHILTWIFGLHVLRMNPVLLLGAMTGAGTCTAAMNSVKDDCRSSIPVIGYTVPYAIGNVLLTIWGALIVSII